MKLQNMKSRNGNKVPNQFIITDDQGNETFQSYNSIIAKKDWTQHPVKIYLDKYTWDYSVTTGKYRNIFLGESKKDTQAKINSGEYVLCDLNGKH